MKLVNIESMMVLCTKTLHDDDNHRVLRRIKIRSENLLSRRIFYPFNLVNFEHQLIVCKRVKEKDCTQNKPKSFAKRKV